MKSLEHRPTGYEPLYTLKPVAPDLWIADGGWIRFYSMPFPTRMTVVRLSNGELWLHSPIAPADDLAESVAALGAVRYLIAPNWIHYAWIPDWQQKFPDAVTWGSPGVLARARDRGMTLHLDHELADDAPPDWAGQIDQRLAESHLHKEVIFFHQPTRTLILTDLIENFERGNMPWWMFPLLKLGRVCDPDGRMPRDIAASFARRPEHLTDLVSTMIGWEPQRVVIAHGRWFDTDGTAELRRAFRGIPVG